MASCSAGRTVARSVPAVPSPQGQRGHLPVPGRSWYNSLMVATAPQEASQESRTWESHGARHLGLRKTPPISWGSGCPSSISPDAQGHTCVHTARKLHLPHVNTQTHGLRTHAHVDTHLVHTDTHVRERGPVHTARGHTLMCTWTLMALVRGHPQTQSAAIGRGPRGKAGTARV